MLCAGCSHEAPFGTEASGLGARTDGADVLLTYNGDQNYWPTLTQDGTGVLYAFVNQELTASQVIHRCIGIIPVSGGTRSWQYCDNRAALGDSLSSYGAFAAGSDGRLLYAEGAVRRGLSFGAGAVTLWLADTAHPYRRSALAVLPITVGDSVISWIGELAWTSPTTFVALGQQYFPATQCAPPQSKPVCSGVLDSIFFGGTLIRGTVAGTTATFTAIAGGAGATSFSLAENGASIVFTQRDITSLMKIPLAGGAPTVAAAVTPRSGVQLLGVSCQGTTCVVGVGAVTLWAPVNPGPGSDVSDIGAPSELRSVSLANGTASTVLTRSSRLLTNPLLLPDGKSVIAQYGNQMAHLQTFAPALPSTLHLYPALLP